MDTKLTWEQVAALSEDLAAAIKKSGFQPDYLIGIASGGLIPLALVAGMLNIKNILTVSVGSYDGKKQREFKLIYFPTIDLKGKKILLIDEVSETGQTLERVTNIFKEKYQPAEIRTATLVVNAKSSKFYPDFYSLETDEWTVFPWEKEDDII
jgi:hypoxanthine phosphoribosyltransferase